MIFTPNTHRTLKETVNAMFQRHTSEDGSVKNKKLYASLSSAHAVLNEKPVVELAGFATCQGCEDLPKITDKEFAAHARLETLAAKWNVASAAVKVKRSERIARQYCNNLVALYK